MNLTLRTRTLTNLFSLFEDEYAVLLPTKNRPMIWLARYTLPGDEPSLVFCPETLREDDRIFVTGDFEVHLLRNQKYGPCRLFGFAQARTVAPSTPRFDQAQIERIRPFATSLGDARMVLGSDPLPLGEIEETNLGQLCQHKFREMVSTCDAVRAADHANEFRMIQSQQQKPPVETVPMARKRGRPLGAPSARQTNF
jgi:hypothetical protein